MENNWVFIKPEHGKIFANAAEMLLEAAAGLCARPPEIAPEDGATPETLTERSFIYAGIRGDRLAGLLTGHGVEYPSDGDESYTVFVGDSAFGGGQMIVIIGGSERGVLCGCAEFCNRYCGDVLFRGCDIWREDIFDSPLSGRIPGWSVSGSPAIKTRAVWTWGHVIYDYRRFFRNMAKLRLNEIVIWNDRAPVNADAVAEYAHSFGIKVIWGFAWGWTASCRKFFDGLDAGRLKRLKDSIIGTYENEYAGIAGDGIYFQSFTEFRGSGEYGARVAETVTSLVNETAEELFKRRPDLHIQFGLHATSVRDHAEILAKVDPRIYIVWEDCGAFPFDYDPSKTDGAAETGAFVEKLLKLRGDGERFGAVFKGMLKLDWTRFIHAEKPLVIGEASEEYIARRRIMKDRIWKIIQADWMKNAEYARKTAAMISHGGGEPIVEALIEDSMLESGIRFPAALFAELLWDPDRDVGEIVSETAKFPCVGFANKET